MLPKLIFAMLFTGVFIQFQSVNAQQIIPLYTSKTLINNNLFIKSDSGVLKITAYQPNIVGISFSANQKISHDTSTLCKPQNIRVTQNIDDVFFATDSLLIIINKFDLSVRFLKKQNEMLLLSCGAYFLTKSPKTLSFTSAENEKFSLKKFKKPHKNVDFCHKTKHRCNLYLSALTKNCSLYFKNSSKQKTKFFLKSNSLSLTGISDFIFLAGN